MISELMIKHAYMYGERMANRLTEMGVLKNGAYFGILTLKGEKALCFVHYPDSIPTNLGYIFIKDLLNADKDFEDKIMDDFNFVIGA